MKINCCCATDATKAITRIASNRKWSTSPMAIGTVAQHQFHLYSLNGNSHRNFNDLCILSSSDLLATNRYCYECVNKATNERKCIVCGGHRPPPLGKMVYCELCPRAYHHDCYIPPLIKVPRGKWYCHGCASKAPPPKRRGPSKKAKEKDSKDKDSRDGKDSTKDSKGKDKKPTDPHRENSNSNSATSESNSIDQTSLHSSNVPTATAHSSKNNETSQSMYV